MRELHLVCNSHIDPCWQWDIEEGIAAVLSTFKCAADFCEEYDGLIFNHNEALVYEWVEKYAPELFERIKLLVKAGKWHIMGGWYLQPDCNLTSGESLVRQILKGRNYFKKKFDVCPTTAMNVDSFGHTRGLVQILEKSGYDSYIFSRPFEKDMHLESEDFIWEGYDGSRIMAFRLYSIYNSLFGQARKKIQDWISENPQKEIGCIFWGVGDHGGGPSRVDLNDIRDLSAEIETISILHSYPEKYFERISEQKKNLPIVSKGLNHWGPGCYSSLALIKQKHRQLENEYYRAEKIAVHAAMNGLAYPKEKMDYALRELLFIEFHDILPGSCIPSAEETGLRKAQFALEILRKVTFDSFYSLCSDNENQDNIVPIYVYNPHPYEIEDIFECEFMLANMNVSGTFMNPVVRVNGELLPSQCEKEESNFPVDWRKRVAFRAKLKPAQINRFDCTIEELESVISKNGLTVQSIADCFLNPDKRDSMDFKGVDLPVRLPFGKPIEECETKDSLINFSTGTTHSVINRNTGLVDRIEYEKAPIIEKGITPIVIKDSVDSWGANILSFPNVIGEFSSDFKNKFGLQIVENGPVRAVIDAHMSYNSTPMLVRYKIPKYGDRIQIDIKTVWSEHDKMLKVKIPFSLKNAKCYAQMPYGAEEVEMDGHEAYMQQWCMVANEDLALSILNEGIYGFSCTEDAINLTLLRSSAYSAHPAPMPGIECEADYRDVPRMDQGERFFRFWIQVGKVKEAKANIGRWAQAVNEKPIVLSLFPREKKTNKLPLAELKGDSSIIISAFKPDESNDGYILRLFETSGKNSTATVNIPLLNISDEQIDLQPYEIATFSCKNSQFKECSMMEGL